MKGKLYIFGIGGTGSRVLRSLAMLAASGVKMEAEAIVPIIIDPDHANADVTRAVEQLKRYQTIRESLTFDGSGSNRFFRPAFQQTVSDYRLRLNDTRNKRFREFIGFDTLSENNRALASILFSTHNLEAKMEVGFKGNPNIGSVVLNQFDESQDFDDFSNAFRPEDRIFIVSSIFGGTGPAAFRYS